MANPDDAAATSSEYLRLMALVVFAYIWAKMAQVAIDKLDSDPQDREFYQTKYQQPAFL